MTIQNTLKSRFAICFYLFDGYLHELDFQCMGGHAVLGDIGLVTRNVRASMAGTPGFISPDVWNGKCDFETRDDRYK